jgi:tRNA (cytidine/uridine-2'-O-)-methyltransferase
MTIRLALYQPDIPQNTGTLMRLAACFDLGVDLIEPAGFPTSDRAFRRAGMDYLDHVRLTRHASWAAFDEARRRAGTRLVLASTRAERAHVGFPFAPGDVILLGRESAGVPDAVHEAADTRVRIPMKPGLRSLNVAVAGAILIAEAMRATGAFGSLDATP